MWVRVSSSMAKTIPPSGVLKAALRPAAPPVIIITLRLTLGQNGGRSLCTVRYTLPAICKVGPSRPMAPPPTAMARLLANFTRMIRTLRKRQLPSLRSSSLLTSTAAISCGMPLPPAIGLKNRTRNQLATKASGAVRKIMNGRSASSSLFRWCAFWKSLV
jgi:hypothetical protein